ncbi:MAG TPA: hypothetical protein VEQ59_20585 [Polyangiaceae bacterium]|nr:hypothetical protein [Polyangiaceae bacterium]
MMLAKSWWALTLLGVLGCSSSGSDDDGAPLEIASGTLSGKIGGSAWIFAAGESDPFFSEAGEPFWADIYADSREPACSSARSTDKNHLILNVPRTPGDYRLSLTLNATFVIESAAATTDNLVATSGRMVVDEVSNDTVRGKAHIRYDADNEVDGAFHFTVCP